MKTYLIDVTLFTFRLSVRREICLNTSNCVLDRSTIPRVEIHILRHCEKSSRIFDASMRMSCSMIVEIFLWRRQGQLRGTWHDSWCCLLCQWRKEGYILRSLTFSIRCHYSLYHIWRLSRVILNSFSFRRRSSTFITVLFFVRQQTLRLDWQFRRSLPIPCMYSLWSSQILIPSILMERFVSWFIFMLSNAHSLDHREWRCDAARFKDLRHGLSSRVIELRDDNVKYRIVIMKH